MHKFTKPTKLSIFFLGILLSIGTGSIAQDNGKYYRIITESSWYLWPAAITTNSQNIKDDPTGYPYLTTYNATSAPEFQNSTVDYDAYDTTYSIWQVTHVNYNGETYYRLYNVGHQMYAVWTTTSETGRAVHLEPESDSTDETKTYFSYSSNTKKLTPMGSSYSFNSYGGQKSYLVCVNKSNQPEIGSFTNGLIGLYRSGEWTFTEVVGYTANCKTPTIAYDNATMEVTITTETDGATIHYTTDGTDPVVGSSASGASPVTFTLAAGYNNTVKAIATHDDLPNSTIARMAIRTPLTITSLTQILDAGGYYILNADVTSTGALLGDNTFSGILEGGWNESEGRFYEISGLTSPLFKSLDGAVVRNIILDAVNIPNTSGDSDGNVGAIACSATGATRIYNCGVLDMNSSISGTGYVGSILGKLEGNTRVINCYSFATVSGGTWGAGIVGYNSTATTQDNIATSGMVMNCMFYGEVTSGSAGIAPVYGGEIISNVGNLNTFNYFRFMADFCQDDRITAYNCALACKEMYLKRMEFYRILLNSNRELAAWYATGATDDADSKMAKWVMDKSIAPYPILKVQGKYPSIINFDAAHATTQSERNQGGLMGTLTVNVTGTGTGAPSGASLTKNLLILNITDKDTANYNFNYYKVQLPYYNEVGTKNYTGNKVVTGWKVTVSGGTNSYNTSGYDVAIDVNGGITTPYNFADRYCTEKDDFSTSGRIFPQGGYFNVPEGVTSISIEPYWGTAVYLSNPNYDKVANQSYTLADVTTMGSRVTTITIDGSEQTVYTSMSNALIQLSSGGTVYDQAIVLVGNYHHYAGQNNNPFGNTKPCTIMSIDQNMDNEPDCSLILHFHERKECPPIRFDFINVIPFGMAQKVFHDEAPQMPNLAIFKPKGWFEVTTTCLIEFNEFEYDYKSKSESPLIFMGGYIGQITSQNSDEGYNPQKTTYIHLGDNVYFKDFCNGIHSDKSKNTRHCPISVTGGEYENFYLSGLYKPGITPYDDGAECYINGGKFGEVAGAAHEKIKKDVYWFIDHADIDNFYGGGINDANPVLGNINVTINNSNVGLYCGGPKYGYMSTGKTVTTQATGTTFGVFFGAGYGGTALNRVIKATKSDAQDYSWETWDDNYTRSYSNSDGGIATSFETEFFAWAGGTTTSNVGRFYVNFASLSLATTYNVYSTLSSCTVLGNFYGGGSLGAVLGNDTSVITDCRVYGNVFGAGYSAQVPTVDVFPNPPEWTQPSYNKKVGLYKDPVYPIAVKYTWSDMGSTSNPFTDDGDNHWIYTDVDLNGLGKVTGNVTLTINGSTTVGTLLGDGSLKAGTGDVFGGGDESAVQGNTSVILEDDADVKGNVYGGGNQGDVDGSARVTIQE